MPHLTEGPYDSIVTRMKNMEEQAGELAEVVRNLFEAVERMQAAQSKLITALRPTHDRRLISEALNFSEECADRLKAVRERLTEAEPEAKAA
jgi:hypothetical protein